jgi:membrane-bound inhibitor of C-type lysozyme
MKIEWNKVTRFSQLIAIVLFVGVFYYGFFLGGKIRVEKILGAPVSDAVFQCDAGKSIHAIFYKQGVHVALSGAEDMFLLQTISASGARYATEDESLVFWNKGDEALVMRNNEMDMAYKNCAVKGN